MRLLILCISTFLTCAAGAAAAELPLRAAGAGELVLSDGDRFAAWGPPGGGDATVVDARTAVARSVARPEGCSDVAAVGAGQLMWACEDAERDTEPALTDLADGTVRRLVLPETLRRADGPDTAPSLDGIGRAWIAGVFPPVGSAKQALDPFYFNWRTGVFRRATPSSDLHDLDRRNAYTDLDADGLVRRLCAGARARRGERSALWAVRGRRVLRSTGFRLVVDTCAGRRIQLTDCGRPEYRCGGSRQLGAGWAVWTEAGRVRAYDLRRGRRYTSRRLGATRDMWTAVVRGAVYVAANGRIYRARLPR